MAELAVGGDVQVQVRMTLHDDMSRAAASALDALAGAAMRTNKVLAQVGSAGLAQLSRDATAVRRALDGAASSLGGMAERSRSLGNSLRTAQRGGEKLRSSLDAASDAGRRMTRQIAGIRKELNSTAASAQKLGRNLGGTGGVGAAGPGKGGRGFSAADMYQKGKAGLRAGQEALARPISFEAEVARFTNEFYRDQNVGERGQTRESVRGLTEETARAGGGTREQALQALSVLREQGLDQDTASAVLGAVQKGATAHGVDPAELARVVAMGVTSGQFAPGEVERALDKALASMGGSGTVEELLLALPQLFQAGAGADGGFGYEAALASLSGVSRVADGDAERAGEMTAGLLRSLETEEVRQAFSRQGVDLGAELGSSQGGERVAAMAARADQLMAGDSTYEQLKTRLATAGDDVARSELAGQLADYTQNKALGEVFQDRDDRIALMGLVTQQDVMGQATDRMREPLDYTQRSFAVMQDTTAHKAQQLGNDRDTAASDLLDNLKGPLDASLQGMHELSAAFPQLAEAVYGAGAALDILSAADGGKGGGTGIGGVATGLLAIGGKALKGFLGRVGPAAVGMSAVEALQTESDPTLTRAEKNTAHAATVGGLGGTMAGAAMGAAVGSVVPVIGTAVGGLIGGLLGYLGGSTAGRAVGEELFGSDEPGLAEPELATPMSSAPGGQPVPPTSGVNALQPEQLAGMIPAPVVNLAATLRVDSYDLACAVERLNTQQALRA